MPSKSHVLSALGVLAVTLGACQTGSKTEDDSAVTQRAGAASPGKEVEIDLPAGVPDSRVHEIAAFVETQGGIEQAAVKLQKGDQGPTSLTLELWGPGVGSELAPAIRQQFPELASAAIRELDLAAGGAPSHGLDQVDIEGDDPDTAKQKIVEQLRADGVEGDIEVDVSGNDEKRRVEVRVERHEQAQ